MLAELLRLRQATAQGPIRPSVNLAALEESDLSALNRWLSITRLRTTLTVIAVLPVIRMVAGLEFPLLPVLVVCGACAALSPLYERWMARGGDLRRLVYVQLIVDTLAITAGLAVLGPSGLLFRYFYLLTIVPAAMVSGTCGAVITLLGSLCHAALLMQTPLDVLHEAAVPALFFVAVFIFATVANQCFFYKQHVRDKNRDLAATGDRLAQANAELKAAAETALGLVEVGRAVGTSLDLGIVIDRLHTVVADRLDTEWCATILADASSPSGYRLMASRGLGVASRDALGAAFWDFGALVAAEGVLEVQHGASGPSARALHDWDITAGLFAAMRCGNRVVGMFAAGYRSRPERFTPLQRELVVGIATQAAVAIENATLHARQREEAETSAALLQISELLNASLDTEDRLERLTRLTCPLVDCDFVNILLYDAERACYRITAGTDLLHPEQLEEARQLEFDEKDFPILQGLGDKGWAEHYDSSAEDLIAESWMTHWSMRSIALVPLRLRGETIGALAAGSHRRAEPFAPKVRRLMTGIAHQTVTALENGRLVCNLRAANNLKSEFIGTMSHELRTPLNAIIGYNELLGEAEFGPVTARQREVCGKVLEYSRQLLELIQATLDVSRLESGAMPVTLARMEVAALLDEIARQVPSTWAKPRVQLEWRADSALPAIESDPAKLKMIVRNLVHNALKFTDEGTVAVDAVLDPDGAALTISVTDSGIGMSDESQAIIFDMFRQVDGSDRRRHDGVGLGLYIVRRLVALLGGTIRVESALGRGSRFAVSLPIRPATTTRARPLRAAG